VLPMFARRCAPCLPYYRCQHRHPPPSGLVIVQIFLNYLLFHSSSDIDSSSALISVLSECPVCTTKQQSNARSSSVGDGNRKKNNLIMKEILQRRPNWRDGFDDIQHWLPPGFSNSTDILEEEHRKETSTTGFFNPDEGSGGIFKNCDCLYGDFNVHYNFHCGRSSSKKAVDAPPECISYAYSRDLWLLRFAQEPSVQEFYLLLRAQLQRHI